MLRRHAALRFRNRCSPVAASVALAALLVGVSACGSDGNGGGSPSVGGGPQIDPSTPGTEAGAGGAAGSSGSGGTNAGSAGKAGDFSAPMCDPAAHEVPAIELPNPLISVGMAVTASSGVNMPERLVDGSYGSGSVSFGAPTADAPSWVAFPLEAELERLLLVWADSGSTSPYNDTVGAPAAYSIETSADSTDGEDGTWEPVVNVEANAVHARGHSFDVAGKTWVRFVAEAVPEGASNVVLTEIALYDVSASGAELPQDTWAFLGDSITQGAFGRNLAMGSGFDSQLNSLHEAFMPAMINGGIGGEYARDGANRLAEFLELNADFKYIGIAYGTNDSWGNKQPASFEATLRQIIEAVLDAGRVPVLARIPFATVQHDTLPAWNEVIDRLSTAYELPCGPDLYGWFRDHPEDLSADGVHPRNTGYAAINRLWAEAASTLYVDP